MEGADQADRPIEEVIRNLTSARGHPQNRCPDPLDARWNAVDRGKVAERYEG